MLSRGNSDAAVRLRRAKSTSSVPRRGPSAPSTHSDPHSTHNNALTAATSAFERANGVFHTLVDRDVAKPVTRPSPRRLQRSEGSHLARERSNVGTKDRRVIKVKAEPSQVQSVQDQRSASPINPVLQKSIIDTSQRQGKFPVRDTDITSNNAGFIPPSKTNHFRFESTPTSELESPRKTTIPASSLFGIHAKPASEPSTRNVVAAPTAPLTEVQKAIHAIGQDKYAAHGQSHGLAQHRSSIAVPSKPRHQRFRRDPLQPDTTRNDENIIVDTKVNKIEDSRQTAVQTAVEDTTRALQSTFGNLKKRLKSKFEQASNTRIELPFQHVEAKREHFGRGLFTSSNKNPSLSEQIMPNTNNSSHPQVTAHHSQSHRSKLSGSSTTRSQQTLRSLEEMSNLRSRVTSWADSSGQSTIAMAGGNALSRIQERPEASNPLLDESIGNVSLPVVHRELQTPLRKRGSNFDRSKDLDLQQLTSLFKTHVDTASSENQHAKVRYRCDSVLEDLQPYGTGSASASLAATTVDASNLHSSFAVRPVHIDISQFGNIDTSNEPKTLLSPLSMRAEVMSPSIYSLRPTDESAIPFLSTVSLHQSASIEDVGIALVAESHHVSKWTLGKAAPDRGEPRIVTSNEWRAWASGEVADLDSPRLLTTTDFSQRQKKSEAARQHSEDPQSGQTSTLRTFGKGRAPAPKQVSGLRPKLVPKHSSQMNDRFPMFDTDRKRSNHSAASSQRTASSQSRSRSRHEDCLDTHMVTSSTTIKNVVNSIHQPENKTQMKLVDRERPGLKIARMKSEERGLGQSTESVDEVRSGDAILLQKQPINVLRDLQSNNPGIIRRKAIIACSPRSPLDEKLVTRIRKGPYAPPSPSPHGEIVEATESLNSSALKNSRRNVAGAENTPPSNSRRMVDDFLSSRSSLRLKTSENNSPVFL